MLIKTSRFNIQVPLRRGRSILYNSFARSLSLLEAEDNARFEQVAAAGEADLDDPFSMELLSSGSILPRDVDELALVRRHYQSSRQEADTATLTLCPTLACNFACDYCFQGVHKPTETMSGEVQDAVLRLFERIRTTHRNLRLLHVAWHGGEPLQRVSVVKDLSDKLLAACREQGINYVASMVSNGFFLTREVAQALAQRGLSLVQITIDGPEDVHDARRHLKSRRGSYAKIISNIQSWIPADICPLRDRCGTLWCSALVPFRGREVVDCVELAARLVYGGGFEPQISLLGLSSRQVHVVVGIFYDREAEGHDALARSCYDAWASRCCCFGFATPETPGALLNFRESDLGHA